MSDHYPTKWHEDYYHSRRIEFLTDAVYAILLTLLVLDLHIPKLINTDSPHELWMATKAMGPHFWSFLITFLWLANSWVASQSYMRLLVKNDMVMLWVEIFMLLLVCLFPFPTALMGEYPHNPMGVVYFGVLAVLYNSALVFYTHHCVRKNYISKYADLKDLKKKIDIILPISILVCIAPIIIAFYNPIIAQCMFLLMGFIRMTQTGSWKLKKEEAVTN